MAAAARRFIVNEVQWFPGHMATALRRLASDVRIADVVVEVADARVPRSGRNPTLAQFATNKARLLVLDREDLADPRATAAWLDHYEQHGQHAVAVNGKTRGSAQKLRDALRDGRARGRHARLIVVGIPNAGKSTVINALVGRNVARVEDRAGVTRAAQWFRAVPALEVLDTAGILPPKIDTPQGQWMLALCGAVPRARFDPEDVIASFVRWAQERAVDVPDLEAFARQRQFVRRGNIPDISNAAWSYIREFNDGRFGRMTLELPQS